MTDTTERDLWAAIAAKPGEDTPKLALADWYAEHGNPVMEHALRWCVARNYWPYRSPKARVVRWFRRPQQMRKHHPDHLPAEVYDSFRPKPAHSIAFRDERRAVAALAFVLDQLRILTGLPA